MGISVEIDHRLGDFRLRAQFACEGRLTALFGPSGSGKTSVVNAIAGLLRPDRARISVDDLTLVDTHTGVFVPAYRRHIGYVFQEARLFPHMNVRQNLLFAQWFGGRNARAGASFEAVVDMLGVEPLLRRYPSRLSGGEKQRVAIGRAILSHPRLLLMDEPLASLDEPRKQEILPYIERLRDEAVVPIVYVSHSVDEVRRLADHIVVMDKGEVVSAGPASEALPQTSRASGGGFANVLEVRAARALGDGLLALETPAGEIVVPETGQAPRRIAIDEGDLIVSVGSPALTSAMNTITGVIVTTELREALFSRFRIRAGEAELIARAPARFVRDNEISPGAVVQVIVSRVTIL